MILTRKQEEALKIAVERFKNKEKYTCISGYAGSGKSTVIKFIIEALRVPHDDVAYVAYTGKAAQVLASKGCLNATTAHKLLYYAKPMPNGTYIFTPKAHIEYKIVVVDEISMLPAPMWQLLLTHNVYVLACGDPGQLPSIHKDDNNHVLDHPHIFLDEIMRQAQDSEIIRLSMWVREGKPLSAFPCADAQVKILTKNEVAQMPDVYDWPDQVLCATNSNRQAINNLVRQRKGFGPTPEVGDKVISLTNHWDISSESGEWALTNGSIGEIECFSLYDLHYPNWLCDKPVPCLTTNIILPDGDKFNGLPIDYTCLTTGAMAMDNKQIYLAHKKKLPTTYDFAYAYAITTHKAQGSSWPKVLVFEEWFPNIAQEHQKWLYTAITRAEDKLVLVRK